ncbi:MAG: relaxase/mobilization nuclease domain-containing protein [Raoultibacter sp.]
MAQNGCMLKSVSSHLTCSYLIQDYLERDNDRNRALAHDFVNLYFEEQKQWAEVMDRTRHQVGNDRAWCGKQAVTYQQFVISPSPADNVNLDTLRELTMQWVHEFFGNGIERGVLGDYQVAVVYHDDNDAGIPHAHVVVNNTDLETCRRLHIDSTQNDALQDRLQNIAEEHGLSFFDNVKDRVLRGSFITRTERERIRSNRWCYKQDLRNMVDIAMRTSRDESGFLSQLARMDVRAYIKDGDYVFEHPVNPGRNHATGYRLGKSFSREALLYERQAMVLDGSPRNERVSQNIARHIELYVADMKVVASVAAWTTLEEAAKVLKLNDYYCVRSIDDYDRIENRLQKNLASATALGDPDVQRFEQAIEDIRQARDIARDGDFFEGVLPQVSSKKKANPLSAGTKSASNSGNTNNGGRNQSGLQKLRRQNSGSGRRGADSPPKPKGGGQQRR